MSKRKKWVLGIGLILGIVMVVVAVIASAMAHRLDPYIRQQVLLYLQKRFDSEVEIQALHISLPNASSLRMFLTHRRGVWASVEGEGVLLRHKGRRDIPALFMMKSFSFNVDLAGIFDNSRIIQDVTIDGMEINIPPKGQRPNFNLSKDPSGNESDASGKNASADDSNPESDVDEKDADASVVIERVLITNSRLTILPRDSKKVPLRFDIHRVHLESAGKDVAMKYVGALTNAKPPGEILSEGTFGPWAATDPGDTPLNGGYDFDKADLGVFAGISGILHSTGRFNGTLSSIDVAGEASVPDFALKRSGNAVPLVTRFQVHVDGTNGDTVLKPVIGTLGTTIFTTSGTVIKNYPLDHRSISLVVNMPKGNLRDVLSLAMKGSPFMEGHLQLNTKIDIPPLSGKVREKLLLDGTFEVSDGKFLNSNIQDQIDSLSRRSQGQPKNEDIDEVVSRMGGRFKLENEVIQFTPVSFYVPGSGIDLSGSFDFDQDVLDFQGTLKMQAKVSETLTGWKHWVAKPLDSFFSKQGAGTLLNIKVEGTAESPKFGLNRGGKNTGAVAKQQ